MIAEKNIKRIKFWIFISFFILSFLLVLFSGLINFNETALGGILSGNLYISIILYIFIISIAISTSLPSTIVALAGVAIFTLPVLIITTITGMTIGLSFMFFFARKFGKEGLSSYSKIEGKKLKAFLNLIKMNSTSFVVLFTFFYFLPSNLASVAGALGNMKFKKFVLIALAGNSINLSGFILLLYGIYSANWYFVVPSFMVLLLNSAIPLYIYRRNIRNIILFVFSGRIKLRRKK